MDAEIEEMIARLRDWEVRFPEIVRRRQLGDLVDGVVSCPAGISPSPLIAISLGVYVDLDSRSALQWRLLGFDAERASGAIGL